MANAWRGLRWRAAWAVVTFLFIGAWWYASGGPSYILQIDYSWTGDMIRGADVILDGEVIGTLEPVTGNQPVTGFKIEKGEHTVTVRHEDCTGRPETFTAGSGGRRILFMADIDERFEGGVFRCTIRLRN